jgi:hypothetical protein
MFDAGDTSPAAREAQLAVFRSMSASERVALAFQMSEEARAIAADGFRQRHPDASDVEVERAVRRLLLGAELADRVEMSSRDPLTER